MIAVPLAHAGGRVYGPGGAAELLGIKPTTLAYLLANDALLIVGAKKGKTNFTIQFKIQDFGGFTSTQYRTDKFVIENDHLSDDHLNKPFTGEAPFTLHVHKTVTIYRLKGHTGGPKVESAGYIYIGDIVYN